MHRLIVYEKILAIYWKHKAFWFLNFPPTEYTFIKLSLDDVAKGMGMPDYLTLIFQNSTFSC